MAGGMEYLTRTFLIILTFTSITASKVTEEQIDHFLDFGYIVIKNAFTKEKADDWTKDIWFRLNMDPNDKSTWNRERIHMPFRHREAVATFAPTVRFNYYLRRQ